MILAHSYLKLAVTRGLAVDSPAIRSLNNGNISNEENSSDSKTAHGRQKVDASQGPRADVCSGSILFGKGHCQWKES